MYSKRADFRSTAEFVDQGVESGCIFRSYQQVAFAPYAAGGLTSDGRR